MRGLDTSNIRGFFKQAHDTKQLDVACESKKRVSEIFNPGGFPKYTYNPRKQLKLEEQFNDYLETGYKLLSLTGPTKSGKTVLCKQLVPKGQCIWISGGDIRQEDDFWDSIIDNLGLYTEVTSEHSKAKDESVTGEVAGGISGIIAKVDGKVSGSQSNTEGYAKTFSRTGNPRTVAINALTEQTKPVIIDDFHYIPRNIQINIVRSMKSPIFEGLRLVLISVPHRADDTTKIESEMTGRVQQLKIPPWRQDELQEIAQSGFSCLKIKTESLVNQTLASESFGNPQLMQEFCAHICKINNISETLPKVTPISKFTRTSFFNHVASLITSKADFELLARGPRQRSDRKIRDFVNGKKGDIYLAILIALANTGPKTTVTYEELRTQLKTVLNGDLPQLQQVSQVLAKMQELSSISEGKPRIIEWDNISNTLYLLDPYFAFYLRWAIRWN
jgi:hypothetical protein